MRFYVTELLRMIGAGIVLAAWCAIFILAFETAAADHPVHTWIKTAEYQVVDRYGRRKIVCHWEATQHPGMQRTTSGN